MKPTPPRVIFIDAVGTLFHLRQPVGQTYAEIAATQGIQADAAALDKGFRSAWRSLPAPVHPEGAPSKDDDRSWWEELVRRTFQQAMPVLPEASQMAGIFDALYDHYAYAAAWRLWDDTIPALEQLRVGRKLLVLSNFDKRLRNILEGLEIEHYFDHIIVSSEVGAWKPDPRMFRAALDLADTPPEDCLHVGDDPRADGEGAQAAGLRCFLLKRPETTLSTLAQKVADGGYSSLQGGAE